MAILFPTALDNFINPSSTTPSNASAGLRHSEQHGKLNDSIEGKYPETIGGIDAADRGLPDRSLGLLG